MSVSVLSQTLSSSSAPLWFGAQQCLEQSWLPTPIRQRTRGSRSLTKDRQPMTNLLSPVPRRAWTGR